MVGLNPYSIGPTPNFDPCEKCFVKACCSKTCDDKFRWNMNNVKQAKLKIKFGKRRKKK